MTVRRNWLSQHKLLLESLKVEPAQNSPITMCNDLMMELGKKDDNKGVSDELKQRVDDLETLLHNSLGGIAAIQADMAAIPKILEAVKKAKADGKL